MIPSDPNETVTWKVLKYFEKVHQVPGEAPRAGGSCENCGRSIRYVVRLKSSKGDVLDVGTDCAVTMEGGPALAEIRAAERAYEHECYLASPEYARAQAERISREARMAALAAIAEVTHAEVLRIARSIQRSPHTTTWEKDIAARIEQGIVRGNDFLSVKDILDEEDVAKWEVAAFKASVADSAFVGHVGEKLAFRARLVAMIPCDSAYGRSYVNKFLTDKGESFVWFSKAGTHGPRDLGKAFDVKGTVKAHKEYHGAKETALTRCKLTA